MTCFVRLPAHSTFRRNTPFRLSATACQYIYGYLPHLAAVPFVTKLREKESTMHSFKISSRHFVRNSQHWQSNCITCSKIFFFTWYKIIYLNCWIYKHVEDAHTCLVLKKNLFTWFREIPQSLCLNQFLPWPTILFPSAKEINAVFFLYGKLRQDKTVWHAELNRTNFSIYSCPFVFLIAKKRLSLKAQGLPHIPPQKTYVLPTKRVYPFPTWKTDYFSVHNCLFWRRWGAFTAQCVNL